MIYREERGNHTQREEKNSTFNKHSGRKSWEIVIIETPELEGWIGETISGIMFMISVTFACVEQSASVPSERDPPAQNLNSGDASTFSFYILGLLLEASALR